MRETIVVLRSDISGEVIPEGEGESFTFSFGKNSYSIDLTRDEADEFKKTMDKYTSAARQEVSKLPRAASTSGKSNKEELQAIRRWAEENGYKPSPRGRISGEIVAAYRNAH